MVAGTFTHKCQLIQLQMCSRKHCPHVGRQYNVPVNGAEKERKIIVNVALETLLEVTRAELKNPTESLEKVASARGSGPRAEDEERLTSRVDLSRLH